MRTIFTLIVCLLAAAPAAWSTETELKPNEIFAADSPSIVLVKSYNKAGKEIALGSGVVIAKDTVVSNCHVIEKAASANVEYKHKRISAILVYADTERDLCEFIIKDLEAPPVRMGSTSQVKVGDAAYAIGAPEGLELTLSGGLISSLRHIPGGVVLQMTTPISPGSSGGGLFDSQARLIGITSYYIAEGEQLNFALPVEWVNELPQRGKLAKTNTKHVAGTVNTTQASNLQTGFRSFHVGDYTTAYKIFKQLAIKGNTVAQFELGFMYEDGDGVPKNYELAASWYRKAAEQGNADAQCSLGIFYEYGSGVPKDYVQAATWYRKSAEQGNAYAQFSLGSMYETGTGVPKDYAQAVSWYRKAAEQYDADAQFRLGSIYENGTGVPQDYAQAVSWYRKAAELGNPGAWLNLGLMYKNGTGVPQDYVAAYALFNFAASFDDNKAANNRNKIKDSMTPSQVEAGQTLTREMERDGVIKALDAWLNSGTQ